MHTNDTFIAGSFRLRAAAVAVATVVLAGCGGGSGTEDATVTTAAAPAPDLAASSSAATTDATAAGRLNRLVPRLPPAPEIPPATPDEDAAAVPLAQRTAAATATADSESNACAEVRPFYWEMGDAGGMQASGVVRGDSTVRLGATIPMPIASASKWIYGAYVAELRQGNLTPLDRQYLTMRAGYAQFGTCQPTDTVNSCLQRGSNGVQTPELVDRFVYGGGHMVAHSALVGLGSRNSATLAAAIGGQLGGGVSLLYSQPQVAGALVMSPAAYATVLRRMLDGSLHIGRLLGSEPVCTNPVTCGFDNALIAPVPPAESWEYSLGHWVESDPVFGDGAFSSPGAFGFYPWIDAGRTHYGVVARVAANGGFASALCGRLLRQAWMTGEAQ